MNKNISINISGIIFHIEEDGYEVLKNYLESISRHFKNYEDSDEIIEDIELRIAEIFHSKVSESKQVITAADVNALIATMGTVADFQAAEENGFDDMSDLSEHEQDSKEDIYQGTSTEPSAKKKLYRIGNRKVFGGVASGIAHYFGIDAIWVRLLFVLLFFNIVFNPIGGFAFIAYLLMWMIVPVSFDLEEDRKIKKLYRDGQSKVLGGVAGGLSIYLGIDISLVRLLFVILVFASGAGLIIYVVLWMITPMAHSVTERMQMHGHPVTISNIQDNIKRSFTAKDGEESAIAKILLLPLRLVALVFDALLKLLGPSSRALVNVLRIFVGAILVLVGFASAIALVGVLLILLGYGHSLDVFFMSHPAPLHVLQNSFHPWMYLVAFATAFIPAVMIFLLGLSAIANRLVVNASVAITALFLWLMCGFGSGLSALLINRAFSTEATRIEHKEFEPNGEVIRLGLHFIDGDRENENLLNIVGHGDSIIRVEKTFVAYGKNYTNALEHATSISYHVNQENGKLILDSDCVFADEAKFRNQSVKTTLFMPYGQKFSMDRPLRHIIRGTFWRTGYTPDQIMVEHIWVFSPSGLKCLNCDDHQTKSKQIGSKSGQLSFDFEKFDKVKINGAYNVLIKEQDKFSVQVFGDTEELDNVVAKQLGGRLSIEDKSKAWSVFKSIPSDQWTRIEIGMPSLNALEIEGMPQVKITEMKGSGLSIKTEGASSLEALLDYDEIQLKTSGMSKVILQGEANNLEAATYDLSVLNAFDLESTVCNIETLDASKAKVIVDKTLKARAKDFSEITYQGNPKNKTTDASDLASIKAR